jgi:hypothetical protein
MQEAFRRAAELAPDRIEFTYRYAESFYDIQDPDWAAALKAWEGLEARAQSDIERQTMRLHEANVLLTWAGTPSAPKVLGTRHRPEAGRPEAEAGCALAPDAGNSGAWTFDPIHPRRADHLHRAAREHLRSTNGATPSWPTCWGRHAPRGRPRDPQPMAHIDLIGTVVIPLINIFVLGGGFAFIGWGKPVIVNPSNFRHRKRDEIARDPRGARGQPRSSPWPRSSSARSSSSPSRVSGELVQRASS